MLRIQGLGVHARPAAVLRGLDVDFYGIVDSWVEVSRTLGSMRQAAFSSTGDAKNFLDCNPLY